MSKSSETDPQKVSVELWLADIGSVWEESVLVLRSFLSPAETTRYNNFLRRERRQQFLVGRILLRMAVANVAGLTPGEIKVIERPGTGPRFVLPQSVASPSRKAPFFSLAHSGRWTACAISLHNALGLDIEVFNYKRHFSGIASLAFCAEECAWLEAQPEAERLAAFYRIWTRREALFKLQSELDGHLADGQLALPLSTKTVLNAIAPERYFNNMTHDDLSIAICSTVPLHDIQLRLVEHRDLSMLSKEG